MPVFAVWISLLATLLGPADDPECYVLGGLDVARAQALADVNVTDLQRVYASDRAASRDRQVLERYAARGYRIVGAGMIRESCRVVARSSGRVELQVSERLAPSWVVSEAGAARRLPRDGSTTHWVVLTGGDGRWRIASVSAVGDPA
jgi:hypothetical protein